MSTRVFISLAAIIFSGCVLPSPRVSVLNRTGGPVAVAHATVLKGTVGSFVNLPNGGETKPRKVSDSLVVVRDGRPFWLDLDVRPVSLSIPDAGHGDASGKSEFILRPSHLRLTLTPQMKLTAEEFTLTARAANGVSRLIRLQPVGFPAAPLTGDTPEARSGEGLKRHAQAAKDQAKGIRQQVQGLELPVELIIDSKLLEGPRANGVTMIGRILR